MLVQCHAAGKILVYINSKGTTACADRGYLLTQAFSHALQLNCLQSALVQFFETVQAGGLSETQAHTVSTCSLQPTLNYLTTYTSSALVPNKTYIGAHKTHKLQMTVDVIGELLNL